MGYGTVFEVPSGTSTITTVGTFNGSNGANPNSPLTIDSNGNLFGTTYYGGDYSGGTVFELSGGTIKTVGSLNPSGSGSAWGPTGGLYGQYPTAGIFIDSSGNLFGVASYGGYYGDGTVFAITPGPYNQTIQAYGGTGSLTFSVTSGNFPTWLTLSSTGVLSGTPTASGSYTFTVTVTDSVGASAQFTYTLKVTLPS